MDSGSTGNYISDRCLAALNILVVPEDEHENLTLPNESVVQAQGYAQFVLRCGDFKCPIIARVFPNLQHELILGMPWLIQENPNIDWAARTVRVTRRGVIHNLPTIHQAAWRDNRRAGSQRSTASVRRRSSGQLEREGLKRIQSSLG